MKKLLLLITVAFVGCTKEEKYNCIQCADSSTGEVIIDICREDVPKGYILEDMSRLYHGVANENTDGVFYCEYYN